MVSHIRRIGQKDVVCPPRFLTSKVALNDLEPVVRPDRFGRIREQRVQFNSGRSLDPLLREDLPESGKERSSADRRIQKTEMSPAVLELVPDKSSNVQGQIRRRGKLAPPVALRRRLDFV